jgi:hypothetical protein
VDDVRLFNKSADKPLVYTTQLSLLARFSQNQNKKSENDLPVLAYVFDPSFRDYCLKKAKELSIYKNDKNLFGHFSDNELPFQNDLIKEFSAIRDADHPAFIVLQKWLQERSAQKEKYSRELREEFSGFVAHEYFKTVSEALKKYDPQHLFLGSRLHASAKTNPFVLAAADKYNDIISINFYGYWNLTSSQKDQWSKLNKPFIITEFYTKAEDSGMGNISGAGWLVKTQEDRGIHYQNFGLHLLQLPNCVGWHWFRYQDNDPTDPSADPSNNDSNKGLVNNYFEVHMPLALKMRQLNRNIYSLIHYYQK